jgi:cyclic pyranopterin monophosphate synthase
MSDAPAPTHLNQDGEVHMVNVGDKPITSRRAVARAVVRMREETVSRLMAHDAPKGDVGATVRIAGIMAAKRTWELVPLCHPVGLTRVAVDISWTLNSAEITATTETQDRTGIEMEAMTAASVAALTLYDMVKGMERGVSIERIELIEKSGGRSGHWVRKETL